VLVLVQTGTEIVQGQSVIVKVLAEVTVYVLPAWVISVADGQYVVTAVTTLVVQLSGAAGTELVVQAAELVVQTAELVADDTLVLLLLLVEEETAEEEFWPAIAVLDVQTPLFWGVEETAAGVVVLEADEVVAIAASDHSTEAETETARAATTAANFILIGWLDVDF